MDWNYPIDPCACCGDYNHWAQDCPYSEHGYNGGPNVDFRENCGYGGGYQDSHGKGNMILDALNAIHQELTKINQGFDRRERVYDAIDQHGELMDKRHDEFLKRRSEELEHKVTHEVLTRDDEDRNSGDLLIAIQIGEFKTENALLDYGAKVSILPGYIYDNYDLGPLYKVNASMILPDLSRKRPRGVLKGLTVKVGDFYYLEDFVVLDSEPAKGKEQTRVILGRPFLATVDARIHYGDGTIDMTYGSRKVKIDLFSQSFEYSLESSCSWDRFHSLLQETGSKESVAVIEVSRDVKDMKDKKVKSPWWLKMRNKKKNATKIEEEPQKDPKKESPKDATKSKKRLLEVNMGVFSQLKEKKKPARKIKGEFSQSIDFDLIDFENPDHLDAIWNEGWQWDTNC